METFKFRFRFELANEGLLKGEDKQYEFTLPNKNIAHIQALNAEKFSESTKFAILCG